MYRERTGVLVSLDSVTVSQHAQYQDPTVKLKQLNGIQPSLILLFTHVILLL